MAPDGRSGPGPTGPRWSPEHDRTETPVVSAVSIRRASLTDASAVAEFQTRCWREAYAALVPQAYLDRVGVPEREVRWRDRIRTGSRTVALAEREGRLVGVVSWGTTSTSGAPSLELMSLYVSRAERGGGLGGRLLRHAIGDEPATLWVFEANVRARAFYGRHGFVPDGRRRVDVDTGCEELLYARRRVVAGG